MLAIVNVLDGILERAEQFESHLREHFDDSYQQGFPRLILLVLEDFPSHQQVE